MGETPQTVNQPRLQYPSVPSPSQDPASLQVSVERLIDGYNLLTGQTGNKSYSMVEGLVEIRKQAEHSTARILELNEVTVSANAALAQRTTILEAEVTNARGGQATLSARITQVDTARVDGDNALAQRATNLEVEVTNARGGQATLSARITQVDTARIDGDTAIANSVTSLTATVNSNTANITSEAIARANADSALSSTITSLTATVDTNTASITSEATARANADSALSTTITTLSTTVGTNTANISAVTSSVNGISVRFGVQGYINGSTGGFVFTGVLRNDGAVIYNMEFFSNVIIHGSLTIDGTITTPKAVNNAWSQTVSAGSSFAVSVGITTRGTGAVTILGYWVGEGGFYSTSSSAPGQMSIYRDGALLLQGYNTFSRDTTYAQNPTTKDIAATVWYSRGATSMMVVDSPPAGFHTYTLTEDFGNALYIFVIENAK